MPDLLTIAQHFDTSAREITPLGQGLINDTYKVSGTDVSFVLQRINRHVFPQPEQIMVNLALIFQHLQQKEHSQISLQIPSILACRTGDWLYQDQQQNYWRALSFIEQSESLESIRTLSDAEQIGFALGHFHALLSDVNPTLLHDTLPGFHIAPDYLKQYHCIRQRSLVKTNQYCTDFIDRHQGIIDSLESAKQQGLLRLRVIHGDPKLNNFLFHQTTHRIISLIDLDTVKPGLVHYDIGDCLRSCCHNVGQQVFNLDIANAILKNYLAETASFFTEYDYHYLYSAIRLIPFELALRFYTDYLDGNQYFKTSEPEQNLLRAIEQFQLCEAIIAKEKAITKLIAQMQA